MEDRSSAWCIATQCALAAYHTARSTATEALQYECGLPWHGVPHDARKAQFLNATAHVRIHFGSLMTLPP